MTITKQKVLSIVREFPKRIEMEDLLYRFYLLQKIEVGEADIHHGKTLFHSEVKKKIAKYMQR